MSRLSRPRLPSRYEMRHSREILYDSTVLSESLLTFLMWTCRNERA